MDAMQANEKLKQNCVDAIKAIDKLKNEKFNDIKAKIEWCVASYDNDKNPVGLHESCVEVLQLLSDYKKENPKKITKKIIDGISKSIKDYEKVNA